MLVAALSSTARGQAGQQAAAAAAAVHLGLEWARSRLRVGSRLRARSKILSRTRASLEATIASSLRRTASPATLASPTTCACICSGPVAARAVVFFRKHPTASVQRHVNSGPPFAAPCQMQLKWLPLRVLDPLECHQQRHLFEAQSLDLTAARARKWESIDDEKCQAQTKRNQELKLMV